MGASPPCPHAAIRIAATPASSAHQQASWGTTGVLHGLNQRFLRSQKADSAGCRSSSRGSGNVRERWNRSVRRRFPYRYLLLRPRLRSRALRREEGEGTKKRETDRSRIASCLRSEEVRSSGPRRARSLVCQTNRLHGVLGT